MNRLKNWIEDKLFWLKTGIKTETANGGKPIDQVVIQYNNFFFMVDIDVESGEPTGDFGWSEGMAMTHTPIREHYVAIRRSHE